MILLSLWGSSDSLVVMMVVVVPNVYCSNPISPLFTYGKKENVEVANFFYKLLM